MPRKRKPKPDDIKLTLTITKRWSLKSTEGEYLAIRKSTLEDLRIERDADSTTKARGNKIDMVVVFLERAPFQAFMNVYANDKTYSMWVEEGNDADRIDYFLDDMFTSFYEECERNARKPKAKA